MPRVSQQHLDARRRQILDAAGRCFVRNGFHHTSMQDIFAESGLSAGAVYRYFSSKGELIGTIGNEALSSVTSTLDAILDEEPPPPMRYVVDRVIADMTTNAQPDDDVHRLMVQLWAEALHDAELAGHFRTVYTMLRGYFIEAARRVHHSDTGIDPELVGKAAFSLIPGAILQRALLSDPPLPDYRSGVAGLLGEHAD